MASSERDEQRRGAFREYVRGVAAERFVFVDECSTNVSLSPIFARAPKGERARGKAPRNWGKNVSLICAIDSEGVKPSMSMEGAVDSGAFEAYVERLLVSRLKRGQIVVMDNLSVHKSKKVERLVEDAGCGLLFLPSSDAPPDMNPIEEAFSKVKGALRKAAARSREALVEATGRALDSITPQDIRGFYADCGYRLPLQSRCENRSRRLLNENRWRPRFGLLRAPFPRTPANNVSRMPRTRSSGAQVVGCRLHAGARPMLARPPTA